MKQRLFESSEELVNLINFLILVDYSNGSVEIKGSDGKGINANLECDHFGNCDIKELHITNGYNKNIVFELCRHFDDNSSAYGYLTVLGTKYKNTLDVSFYENGKTNLSIHYDLTDYTEKMKSFKPITIDEFMNKYNSMTYTKNRNAKISYPVNVEKTPEEIEEEKKRREYKTKHLHISYLGRSINPWKTVIETKDIYKTSKYKIDDKGIREIEESESNLFFNGSLDIEVEKDTKPIDEEINEFMDKMPLFTKEELYSVLDELLKEYNISHVKKMKRTKKKKY